MPCISTLIKVTDLGCFTPLKMKIKSQKDFYSGLMFTALGIAFAWGSTSYKMGTGSNIGPGYFPLVLSVLMALLGVGISFFALGEEGNTHDNLGKFAWRPLFFILLANVVFGVFLGGVPTLNIPSMGLVLSIYALTLLAALSSDAFKLKEVLIVATVLAVMSYIAFVALLKLRLPLWPAFIAG
jgi:hypothetical protein